MKIKVKLTCEERNKRNKKSVGENEKVQSVDVLRNFLSPPAGAGVIVDIQLSKYAISRAYKS